MLQLNRVIQGVYRSDHHRCLVEQKIEIEGVAFPNHSNDMLIEQQAEVQKVEQEREMVVPDSLWICDDCQSWWISYPGEEGQARQIFRLLEPPGLYSKSSAQTVVDQGMLRCPDCSSEMIKRELSNEPIKQITKVLN